MEMASLQIQIFLLLVVGYLLAKNGYFDKETRKQVTNIILTVVLPCAIIKSFQLELTREIIVSTGVVLLISIGIQIMCSFLSLFIWNWLDGNEKICCRYGTIITNGSYMGMPIVESIYGSMGLLYASVFLIPQRIVMFSAGISLFAGKGQKNIMKKVLLHPCIVAIYIGVALMFLGAAGIVPPKPINKTIASIGQCNTALSMFVIGGILSEVNIKEIFNRTAIIFAGIRLIVIPMIILVFVRFILPVDELPGNVCVVLTGMPAASATAMLAQKYNVDPGFASKIIFVSTVFSLITLPLITILLEYI